MINLVIEPWVFIVLGVISYLIIGFITGRIVWQYESEPKMLAGASVFIWPFIIICTAVVFLVIGINKVLSFKNTDKSDSYFQY